MLSDGRTISYEYDAEERITKVTDSVEGVTEYTYDAMGQLLTETVNGEVVNEMVYDNYGNILQKNGIRYTYSEGWNDRLAYYDGEHITYDAQGNPLNYLGHTLTWEKGRQLKTFDSIAYTYNANGIRTSKTVDGIRHDYLLDGVTILRETWDDNTLETLYDNEDTVCGIVYNGTPYYFHKNLQGDIIAIADQNGKVVARYTYDAWGKCEISVKSTNAAIAEINPYRYRGYYFDTETGFYYLQTRYYDPEIGRFVNGDNPKFLGISGSILGDNLFAYCENEPVEGMDKLGCGPWTSWLSLWDYRTIHNKVADLVRWALGTWRASREVYVKGSKGKGFLDVYDKVSCEYYEVKSSGAAYTSKTRKQMEKYDVAKPLWSNKSIKRGTKKVKGSFYYGAWKVEYKLAQNGLVVYTPKWKKNRVVTAAALVLAITLISIAVFATGGAATPAYAILLI